MARRYDAVVIGAGNGGLTAAATMAKAGKSVLLLEQHNTPGGFATSFVRGRFEFEPSLHEMCEFGSEQEPASVRELFDELGIKLDWHLVPEAYRMVLLNDPDVKDVTMPFGVEAYTEAVEKAAPGSLPSMKKFLALCSDINDALNYMSSSGGHPDPKVMQKDYANFLKCAPYSTNKVLDVIGMPVKTRKIIEAYWCYMGVDCDHFPFYAYAIMLWKYLTTGGYIPHKRTHSISLALSNRILELGGDIWCSTKATRILMKDGKPCGVRTTHGDVETEHVICDCSPNAVFGDMMDDSELTSAQRRAINAREIGMRGFVVYVGLNKPMEELGLDAYSYFIYDNMDTVDQVKCVNSFEKNHIQASICLNAAIPDCSPPGTTIMSFTTFFGADLWDNIAPEDYVKTKRAVADQIFEDFAKATGVDVRPYIEEIEIATPATLARYTLNPKGAMYAYANSDWDSMLARLMMMKEDEIIPGIRFAGGYGPRVYGYNSTYNCGNMTAKLTLADMKGEV